MAIERPEPWDEKQRSQAVDAMSTFAVHGEDGKLVMCDVMGCAPRDLDWLCKQAFGGLTFKKARERYERVGKARIKTAIFRGAEGGNARMLELASRISGLYVEAPRLKPGPKPRPKPEDPIGEVDF